MLRSNRDLPFVIVRMIMDYTPFLTIPPHFEWIRKHLDKKYCHVCGEYIDVDHHSLQEDDPKHIHYKHYKHRYESKKWIYYYDRPVLFLHFWKLRGNSISYLMYERFMGSRDMQLEGDLRFVYRQKGIRYFYNLKRVIEGQLDRPSRRVNILDMNIYWNPDAYLTDEDMMISYRYTESKVVLFEDVCSPCHKENIRKTIHRLLQINMNYLYLFTTYIHEEPALLTELLEKYFWSVISIIIEARLYRLMCMVLSEHPEHAMFIPIPCIKNCGFQFTAHKTEKKTVP